MPLTRFPGCRPVSAGQSRSPRPRIASCRPPSATVHFVELLAYAMQIHIVTVARAQQAQSAPSSGGGGGQQRCHAGTVCRVSVPTTETFAIAMPLDAESRAAILLVGQKQALRALIAAGRGFPEPARRERESDGSVPEMVDKVR
jgi:hypothetical protein